MSEPAEQTLALARSAAGAVRGLNQATLGGNGLAQPADAYCVLGDLSLTVAGLPQLLAQIGWWLTTALGAGELGCDDGTDPAAAVSGAWLFIADARAGAAALARSLEQAQQQIAAVNSGPHAQEQAEGEF